jgi:hypothetical protein
LDKRDYRFVNRDFFVAHFVHSPFAHESLKQSRLPVERDASDRRNDQLVCSGIL